MKSFTIGRIKGIKIQVHILFLVFVAVLVLCSAYQAGVVGALISLMLLLCVFGFVLLHEIGHCLVALHYHIPVRNITLWPLGGIATIEQIPRRPSVEIHIALAGPLVNLALALILSPVALAASFFTDSLFFVYLVVVNLVLVCFNLLPAFPMDGGRIYRAWNANKLGYLRATQNAVRLGTIMAIIIGAVGIFHPWLLVIAIFIVIAGQQELALIEDMHGYYENDDVFVPYDHYVKKKKCTNRTLDIHAEFKHFKAYFQGLIRRHWR